MSTRGLLRGHDERRRAQDNVSSARRVRREKENHRTQAQAVSADAGRSTPNDDGRLSIVSGGQPGLGGTFNCGGTLAVVASADGDAVVMIGRMKMMDGSLMCILADQFLFDA